MEASALQQREPLAVARRLRGLRPLWLQSDEGLVGLVRAGSSEAYEPLVRRYQARLLAFCRQILKDDGDAEDVLQEVFTAAFYAMRADERPLDVRPWFYRIARNRCLNHLRSEAGARALGAGSDGASEHALETQGADGGSSAAESAFRRQDFRQLIQDVLSLPEAQRTALVLREVHGLSYDEIAGAMSTSLASVKSLLVRARGSLLEIAEARELTCDEARHELAVAAEGLARPSSAARLHLKRCSSCTAARKRLKATSKALAAIAPVWPLSTLKVALFAKGTPAGAAGIASASGASGAATIGAPAGGVLALATKAAVGLSGVVALAGGMSVIDRGEAGVVEGSQPAQAQTRAPVPAAEPPSAAAPPERLPAREAGAEVEGGARSVPGPGATPPDAGAIVSSRRQVVPGAPTTERSRELPPSERLPGTTERGRPAPNAELKYRTRPAPPGFVEQPPPGSPPEPPRDVPRSTPGGSAPPAGGLLPVVEPLVSGQEQPAP